MLLSATFLAGLSLVISSLCLVPSASATSKARLELGNGVAIRVVDKTGQTEITNLNIDLCSTPTGAFVSDSFNIEVSTTNTTGYKLYMTTDYQIGQNYTTALVNIEDDAYTIPTLSSAVSKADFSASGSSYVNKWGYSLDDTTYNPAPAHGTTDLIKNTSEGVNKELVPVYLGINADMSNPSATYRNLLVFSAIPNPIPIDYSLYFEPGTEDPVIDLPSTMTASEVAASHTFTIPSTAPSRTGYNFTGYLDEDTSTTYQPGDTITVIGNEQFVGSATLVAQWEVAGCASGANRVCYISNEPSGTVSGTMEDQTIVYMTSSTSEGTVDTTALSGSTTELTLYSPNWTLSGYGFKGWSEKKNPGSTDKIYGPNETITLSTDQKAALGAGGIRLYAQWVANAGNMASWSGCSSLAQGSVTALTYGSDTYAVAKLADGKCWMIENLRTSTNAGTATTSMSTSSFTSREYNLTNVTGTGGATPTSSGSAAYQWKSYGGYYSWASSISSTSSYGTQYGNPSSTTGSTQGICPTGWRLPRAYYNSSTSGTQADFTYLTTQLGGSGATLSNNLRKYPNNFVFAGNWIGTSSAYRGTHGLYWSSTVYGSNYARTTYSSTVRA